MFSGGSVCVRFVAHARSSPGAGRLFSSLALLGCAAPANGRVRVQLREIDTAGTFRSFRPSEQFSESRQCFFFAGPFVVASLKSFKRCLKFQMSR